MRTKHLGEWTNLIRDIDQQWVAKTDLERINLTKSYSQVAAEEFLKQHVSRYTDLVEFEERAPLPGDSDWHRYLMEPYYRTPYFEKMSSDEIREKKDRGAGQPKPCVCVSVCRGEYLLWQDLIGRDLIGSFPEPKKASRGREIVSE